MQPQTRAVAAMMSGAARDWAVAFNATTTSINCGSDGDIDDIHDDAFTVEAWIRPDSVGENNDGGRIVEKGSAAAVGWKFSVHGNYGLHVLISCATTDAESRLTSADFSPDGAWHHVAMFFDDAGDRKAYIAIDGVWVSSYATQTAGVDAVISDAAQTLFIGNRVDGARTFDGTIGWIRISNNDRYNHGTDFTPSHAFPDDDANTLASWNMNEGTGTDIANTGDQAGGGSGAGNRDGTLSNGSWVKNFPLG